MRTFIIGKAKVVASGGDCIYLTPAQYAAAKVLRGVGLTAEELVDLMDQLRDEFAQGTARDDWMPKKVAPSVAEPLYCNYKPVEPAPINTDGMTWQQIADLGPDYKIRAVKEFRMKENCSLKEAVDVLNEYLS